MSIRLEVEGYCQQCLDYSPEVIKPARVIVPGSNKDEFTDTIIRCEYRKRCAGITRYLEQQMKGGHEE